ncbi:TPA: type VI secretion protein ImpA [Enterobacter hormaechei subsp. steigerwaltii]|nr:type VI secretion protein ImpA [Enterobacter hormaechei subsp. steigerwaltii]
MAILHPQECYLLEKFISPEHYAATRDAIIAFVDAHEAALTRYQREIPLNSRNLPLWQQADMVWENRVMPNLRTVKEQYINGFIYRTHNDIKAFYIGDAMRGIIKGIVEFWNGWMTDEERQLIGRTSAIASRLDQQLSSTISGTWREGSLTYRGRPGIYSDDDIPSRIPRYELDSSVRIEADEIPVQTGIYLPDVEFASARFIPADYGEPVAAYQGKIRSDFISKQGVRDYSWEESEWVDTGWTLIRRIEGEFIDVPREGFFPNGTPDELYNWPQREQELLKNNEVRITNWTGESAPFAGRWASTVGGTTQYTQTQAGQKMPEFEDKYGKKYRACWSLLERDDGGSVYIIPGRRA